MHDASYRSLFDCFQSLKTGFRASADWAMSG